MGVFVFLFMLIPMITYSQIQIDDVGDNWKQTVTRAIENIKQIDSIRYNILINTCTNVSFWNGDYSTTEDGKIILISQKDMKLNSLNNISAVLVHESYHLCILKNKIKLSIENEEYYTYLYELDFLLKIPNVEIGLIENCLKMIDAYKSK